MIIRSKNLISLSTHLCSRFDSLLSSSHWPSHYPAAEDQIEECVLRLHRFNSFLWDEEDLARRTKAEDSEIAANKRAIDSFNQERNNQIEQLDELILVSVTKNTPVEAAQRSSETPGSMIDRLSILSLKIHHMSLQAKRQDVDQSHINLATGRLGKLNEQRMDLAESLDELLRGLADGTRYFKIYRQFKMYNDPNFNPVLVAERQNRL